MAARRPARPKPSKSSRPAARKAGGKPKAARAAKPARAGAGAGRAKAGGAAKAPKAARAAKRAKPAKASTRSASGRRPARTSKPVRKAPAKAARKAAGAGKAKSGPGKTGAAGSAWHGQRAPARPVRPAPDAARPAAKVAAPSQAKKAAPARAAEPMEPMSEARPLRITLFGASGHIGSRILTEALSRGHRVTAVMRHPERFASPGAGVIAAKADVTDPVMVETVARGHDAIVSAISPSDANPNDLVDAAKSILQGARRAGVKRVVIVNGAGSLEVAPGRQLLDTPEFPSDWRPVAAAHRDALKVLRDGGGDLDWTAVSPSAMIEPGTRTGKYRTGGDQLIQDAKGRSRISMEDYAAALVDELERERYVGRRMTVGY